MKRLLMILFLLPLFAIAQDRALEVQGAGSNLYLLHTVVAKENYYSIGRLYNISPKVFAPYNELTMEKPLSLGETIKIPLNEMNFSQGTPAAAGEVLVPVYHIVKNKEDLYRISTTYNKVPEASLKKWNNLTGSTVDGGTNFIIGYLKVKKDLSAFASKAETVPATDAPLLQTHPATETKKEDGQVVLPQPVKKELQKEDINPEVKKEQPAPVEVRTTSKEFKGGVFQTNYDLQATGKNIIKETGAAATFKSTSGWEDGKYYCLHNTASPGTIIKVTNVANGKSVYAKVLDVIPDIKQNSGLLIRISNAAAAGLGVKDENPFDCTLEYSK